MTGVSLFTTTLDAKRVGLLQEVVPRAATVAVLVNPNLDRSESLREVETAARRVGWQIIALDATSEGEISAAFATLVRRRADALLVVADPFLTSRRHQIVTLAVRNGVPAIYPWREFAEAGGLLSYGASITDSLRLVGTYAGQILRVPSPATCRSCNPPNSSWSSICRSRRRSASTCHQRCSPAPTR
jgi:putative ABC transport system substrate-binding protein